MRLPLAFPLLIVGVLGACDEAARPSEDRETREPAAATSAPAANSATTLSADSAAVVAAVDAFHAALASGDTATIRDLLTDDLVVAEGGGVENRGEYFGHHLPADMEFAAAVPGTREVNRVVVRGDVAWLIATSRRQGTFRGQEIDSFGAELVVLERRSEGWRIAAVHWSSRSGS